MRYWFAAILGLLFAVSPAQRDIAFAHPGGLNSQGCHNNRQTGEYHCHRKSVKPAPERRTSGRSSPNGQVYYADCDAVRAAGKDPIYRGQPGYRPGLDRDDDGIACEKSRFNR